MGYKIVNMYFASLYPTTMTDFTKDPKFLAELKEIQRKKTLKERREKLEKINNLNESS